MFQLLPNQQSGAKGKAYVTVWNEQLKSGEAASQVASQQIVGMAKASGENSTVMEFLPSKVTHYANDDLLPK